MPNGFNLTAEDLLGGQGPKGLVMCFFKFSDRVRIRSTQVDRRDYRGGHLVAPLIDPETGCTAEEIAGIPVRRPITIKPAKLVTPGSAHLNQKLDEEVA
jgi:hypothetical protein